MTDEDIVCDRCGADSCHHRFDADFLGQPRDIYIRESKTIRRLYYTIVITLIIIWLGFIYESL